MAALVASVDGLVDQEGRVEGKSGPGEGPWLAAERLGGRSRLTGEVGESRTGLHDSRRHRHAKVLLEGGKQHC